MLERMDWVKSDCQPYNVSCLYELIHRFASAYALYVCGLMLDYISANLWSQLFKASFSILGMNVIYDVISNIVSKAGDRSEWEGCMHWCAAICVLCYLHTTDYTFKFDGHHSDPLLKISSIISEERLEAMERRLTQIEQWEDYWDIYIMTVKLYSHLGYSIVLFYWVCGQTWPKHTCQ